MSTDQKIAAAMEAILDFPWWNYGLDNVSDTQSEDWAAELAEAVVAALEPQQASQA
jgi:hypothetical protein